MDAASDRQLANLLTVAARTARDDQEVRRQLQDCLATRTAGLLSRALTSPESYELLTAISSSSAIAGPAAGLRLPDQRAGRLRGSGQAGAPARPGWFPGQFYRPGARAWPCRPTPTRPASGTQCRQSSATIASLPAHGSCHRSSALAMAPAWPQTRSRRCWPATATGTTRRPARIQRPRPPGAEPISHPSLPSTPPSWTARSQCLFPPHRLLRRASRHLTRSCWPRAREIALRKCHEFETDLGARVVRQLRKPSSGKINMSREVRPYSVISHGHCRTGGAYDIFVRHAGVPPRRRQTALGEGRL
jgi:hypothetical protein